MQHISLPSNPILNGSVAALVTFVVNYADSGIDSGVKKATIRADALHPVLLEIFAEVANAFIGGTPVLTLGTNSTANQILGSSDITEGTPGFYPASNAIYKSRIVADTEIWAKCTGSGFAGAAPNATLTSDNTNVADGATVTIGDKVYTFKTALTPAEGEVLIGADADGSLLNLIRAINHSGTAGTDYQCTTANAYVSAATSVTSHTFKVTARTGVTGTVATTETSAHLSWNTATLSKGQGIFYIRVTPLFPSPSGYLGV